MKVSTVLSLLCIDALFHIASATHQLAGPDFCDIYEVQCDNSECIDRALWCNKEIDCMDESDEQYCRMKSWFNLGLNINNCSEKHFQCENSQCVPAGTKCDGFEMCADGSDEKSCEEVNTPLSTEDDSSEENSLSSLYTTESAYSSSYTDLVSSQVRTETVASTSLTSEEVDTSISKEDDRIEETILTSLYTTESAYNSSDNDLVSSQVTAKTVASTSLINYRDSYEYLRPGARSVSCDYALKGRVPWIIHAREPNYGWRDHTHIANIALAVNGYKGTEIEMRQMEIQLEMEIVNAYLKKKVLHDNDLALFIHAAIATNKNPRNFGGYDLVAELQRRVDKVDCRIHPFLVLALCNSHAIQLRHLTKIKEFTTNRRNESYTEIELKALSVKAFACAASLSPNLVGVIQGAMDSAVKRLISYQERDGSFGNAYTTSLVVQALIAIGTKDKWNEAKTLEYLVNQSVIEVNILKAYSIEMAINAKNVRFVKDLYRGQIQDPENPNSVDEFSVRYSLKTNVYPNTTYTVTMRVERNSNFFDIMNIAAKEWDVFKFIYYLNKNNEPAVYSVSGIQNDPDEDMFWRICLLVGQHPSTYRWETFRDSPVRLSPNQSEVIVWYRNTDCEVLYKN